MRISTSLIFDRGLQNMQDQQLGVFQAQQQLSTGLRIQTAKDDPIAATQALQVKNTQAQNDQYTTNINAANDTLGLQDTALADVTTQIQDIQQLVVQAGNPTLNDSNRQSMAADLQQRLQGLLALANSSDGKGGYIFAGYKSSQPPFVANAASVTYQGDQGQRLLQIGPSTQIPVTDVGTDIFERIKSSSGDFTVAAGTNTTATITANGQADTTDPNWTKPLLIKFTSATTYDVVDPATGNYVLDASNNAMHNLTYNPTTGATINVQGKSFTINGSPVTGDSFSVQPVTQQGLFTTVNKLITTLQAPVTDPAAFAKQLAQTTSNLSNALDHVAAQRASVGSRMKQLDDSKNVNDEMGLTYAQTLSQLQDVDYTQAATDLSKRQLALQAAQQSFARIQGLSLFNYLSNA